MRSEVIERLARTRLDRGEDVVEQAAEVAGEEEAWEPPDLVALLKRRLAEGGEAPADSPRSDGARALERRS
jgi:hypothetical protein